MSTPNSESPYLVQLDSLRAFAVLAVVCGHCLPESWLVNRAGIGFLGVRLFFVLSGFLITGILLRGREKAERTKTSRIQLLKRFYLRRFLRIFPAYYFLLFLFAALGLPPLLDTFWWHFSYLSNVYFAIRGEWLHSINHLWSLGVEEQFYIFWPVLMLFAPRRHLGIVLTGAVLLSPLTRYALAVQFNNGITAKSPVFSCMDQLGMGAILAWLQFTLGPKHPRVKLFLQASSAIGVTLLLLLIFFRASPHAWPVRAALLDFSAALIFTVVVARFAAGFNGTSGKFLEWGPLIFLGRISYGVYLFHNLIIWTTERTAQTLGLRIPALVPGIPLLGYVLFMTLLVASVSWRWLENPINRLKDRFPY